MLTDELDGLAPLEPQSPHRRRRRRSKRGLGHRYRKWRSRRERKRYKVFMGGHGASTREIARRYERSRTRRKRVVIGAVAAVVLGVLGVAAGDAYLQASSVLDKVRDSGESLKQVRSNLIRGKLPPEEAFAAAARAIGEGQEQLNGVRLTWPVVRAVPFIGLPVSATERLLEASRHELSAAVAAKELLEEILGQTIEEAREEAEAAAARREEADADGSGSLTPEERRQLKAAGQGPQGGGKQEPAQDDPNALLSNGKVNLARLRELIPKVQTMETELAAAEEAVEAIGPVPFVSKVEDLRRDLIGEIQESRRLAQRALTGLNFIPAFLGSGEQKNYLLLFSDSGFLRGTGGAYFAYAEIGVKSGKLSLVNQGPIIDLDKYVNEPVDHVIPKENWYLETFGLSKRMNNLNWDPHFPHTAPVAAEIYKLRTAGKDINGVVKPEGREVDGVFQIDITGVSYLVDAIGPISVDSWPDPIGGGNLERVALIDSYVELSSGAAADDASDSGAARKAFNEDLVNATWRSLQEPDDLVRTVFQLSRALAERHMQVWVRAPKQQAFFEELGMAGAIKNEPGDYVYAVDQNLGDDTLDVFTSERVDYDVVVDEDGNLDVTATVKATNFVDESMPYPILDNSGPPDKKTYVHLYVPANAELQSVKYVNRFKQTTPQQIEPQLEAGRKVFSAQMSIKPQETASLVFKYRIPDGLLDDDGPLYRLLAQRQPRYVDQSLRVTVHFPEDWDPKGYDDEVWTVTEDTATAFVEALEEDAIFELRF